MTNDEDGGGEDDDDGCHWIIHRTKNFHTQNVYNNDDTDDDDGDLHLLSFPFVHSEFLRLLRNLTCHQHALLLTEADSSSRG